MDPLDAEPERGTFAGADGVELRYTALGTGPAVVLLHGFPDLADSWRPQMPALAAAGFRAVAVDLRGYGGSDRPLAVDDYRMETLARDVVEIARALGGRIHLVGHDWGGMIAWRVAAQHADVVDRVVIMNAPHPSRMSRELRHPGQLLRSAYAALFRVPWLPERLLAARGAAAIRWALRRAGTRRRAFDVEEIRRRAAAFRDPRAMRAALAYYRAMARHPREGRGTTDGDPTRVERPVLLVWGMRDPFLSPRLTHGLERWVPRIRIERIAGAGHWVHRDAPDRVNAMLVDFLRSGRRA